MRGKSKISITIKGLNQERAFTQLSKDVCILKIERKDSKTSTLEIKPRDYKKVKNFLVNNNFEILKAQAYGAVHTLRLLRSSYGIIAGMIFSVALYISCFPFVWQIKVYGNEHINSQEICQFLENNSSKIKTSIDTAKLEILLKQNFERISSVSVSIVGQSLVVNVNEKVLPEEITGNFKAIVSQFDGIITNITLVSGTLMARVGDIVRKGEVLVEPYVIDTDGQQRKVKAEAEIFADVWLCGKSEHYQQYLQTSRTGRVAKISEVQLFGLTIYSHHQENNFKEYETQEITQNLTNNNFLPLKLKTITLYETKTQLIVSEFESEKDKVIDAARQKALLYLKDYEISKEENFSIEQNGGVSVVNFTITVNREIGGKNAS